MSVDLPIVRSARRAEYAAAVGQTLFDFGAPLFDPLDIDVDVSTGGGAFVRLAWPADYAVSIAAGYAYAQIQLTTAPRPLVGSPTATVRLDGRRTHERQTDVTRGGAQHAASLEMELDKHTILFQEQRRDIDDGVAALDDLAAHTLRTPEPIAALPAAAARAGALLGFAPDGSGAMIRSPLGVAVASGVSGLTAAEAQLVVIPAAQVAIITTGFATPGDFGGALYRRVAAEPAHAGKFQDGGGAWFALAEPTVTPQMFGALPGAGDVSTQFQAAIDFQSARGGGVVWVPGTAAPYEVAVTLKSNVLLAGDRRLATLRCPPGVSRTVVESEGFQSLTGVNAAGGVQNCGVVGLRIDGARADTTTPGAAAGHGVAIFGRAFLIDDVEIVDTWRRGLHAEYASGAVGVSPFDTRAQRITVNRSGEEGIWWSVSDAHVASWNVRSPSRNGHGVYDAIVIKRGVRAAEINVWRGGDVDAAISHKRSLVIEGGATTLHGAHLETATLANLYVGPTPAGIECTLTGIKSYSLLSGVHAQVDASRTVLELAVWQQTGFTLTLPALTLGPTAVTGCRLSISALNASSGLLNIAGTGGGNVVEITGWAGPSQTMITGSPHATDVIVMTAGAASADEQSLVKWPGSTSAVGGTGTTQAGARPLRRAQERIYPTTGQTAFILPPDMPGGVVIHVTNASTIAALIWPPAGGRITGLATDAAYTLAADKSVLFVSAGPNYWSTIGG